MKIQCQVCESAEANVMCCADEAALCWACDEKVHAANKLASKHQRVPLSTSSSSSAPKCDICQEAAGHFFCLEDRALLCRNCDVAIHTATPYVSGHQRFLLTGVKVGLESAESGPSSSIGKSPSAVKNSEPITPTGSKSNVPVSFYSRRNGVPSDMLSKLPFSGGSATGGASEWQLDDFIGFMDFHQNDDYGSPKADSSKLVDSDCSPILRSAELDLERDERPGQVPESYSKVPEIPSPPTASGIHWPLDAFVPDITCSPASNPPRYRPHGMLKRRRKF